MKLQNEKRVAGSGKYPGYWRIKSFRRAARNHLSAWLARPHEPAALERIEPAAIRRVLVCRRNKRLGNMLFLTPLLRSLAETLPQAQIDLLTGDARYAGLFEGLPQVRKVWSIPARGLLGPLRFLGLILRLRMQSYDLVVEPSLNSFSNRLLARLCGGQRRLGFHAPDQWLRLTHAVVPDPRERHEALRPLRLISAGFGGAVRLQPYLRIALSDEERLRAHKRLEALLGESSHTPVIGFFAEATAAKRLPPAWWRDWLDEIRRTHKNVRVVQLLPPHSAEALPGVLPLREPDYRALAALLGEMRLFVSADAGPMHLAAASGVPTLGLFRATNSERYRPLSKVGIALDVGHRTPQEVAQTALRAMAAAGRLDFADEKRIPPAAHRRPDDLGQPQSLH